MNCRLETNLFSGLTVGGLCASHMSDIPMRTDGEFTLDTVRANAASPSCARVNFPHNSRILYYYLYFIFFRPAAILNTLLVVNGETEYAELLFKSLRLLP